MISHKLSMLKSLIWRLMGVFIYAAVFFSFTGKFQLTIKSTLVHHTTFLFVFYLHERLYLKIKIDNPRLKKAIKAFTYEAILGMGLGGLIVYIFTGSWSKVTAITGTYTCIKLVVFYLYDGIYNDIINYYAKRSIQKNKET